MAQIWSDVTYAMSNTDVSNTYKGLKFQWYFITFSGETQVKAQVRWRKANTFSSVFDRMRVEDNVWSTPIEVGRFEDMTTWTLSGGQYIPPADNLRKYTNITAVDFPEGFFSPGVWFIQVRAVAAQSDGTTDGIYGGWTTHTIEIVPHFQEQYSAGANSSVIVGPIFPNEGQYAFSVEVMSEAGVTNQSADSATFFVWETNLYTLYNGSIQAVAESRKNSDGTVVRVKRT